MASDERIVLRLDESMEFERLLAEAYRGKPRARRQEWIRSVLRAGFAVLSGHPTPVTAPVEPRDSAVRAIEVPGSSLGRSLAHGHTTHTTEHHNGHGEAAPASADASQIKGLFGDQ